MKNIKISAFLTTIIAILLFDIGCCLAESTRSSDLAPGEIRRIHDQGIPVFIAVDSDDDSGSSAVKFYWFLDEKFYPKEIGGKGKGCTFLAVDGNTGLTNLNGMPIRCINRDELENTLKSAQGAMLYVYLDWDMRDKSDFYIGVNGEMYVFKKVLKIRGIRVAQQVFKQEKPIDFKLQVERAVEEQAHIVTLKNLEKAKAVETFSQCLTRNISNPDLGSSGIPKVCEDSGKIVQVLDGGPEVMVLIENFKKPLCR